MAAAKRVDPGVSIPIKYEEMFDSLFGLYVFERDLETVRFLFMFES